MTVTVTLTTIDPVLRIDDICHLLKMSRATFWRVRPVLEQHGLLVEVLPRLDRHQRFSGAPFVKLFSDQTQLRLVRQEMHALESPTAGVGA